jgi:hypothetical protein
MASEETNILLKNIGFNINFFTKISEETYVIKKEKIRKIFSENAVIKVENVENKRRCFEEEDKECYNEVFNEYGIFSNPNDQNDANFGNKFGNDQYMKEDSNFYDEECEEQSHHNGQAFNNKINNNFLIDGENSGEIQETHNEDELRIFKNCAQSQIIQLSQLFRKMNETSEKQVLVKAYKSKLKSKFYEIYENNSKEFKEKIKFKIFHKCNYPGCSRTFASAGWLRSHFKDHIKEIKKNKFNIMFENFLQSNRMKKLQLN